MTTYNNNGYPVTARARTPQNITKSESALSVTSSIMFANGIYVGQSGHVAVLTKTGSATFYDFPQGGVIPVNDITHVLSATTTASAFVALV